MPRSRSWKWPLRQDRSGHLDRQAFLRPIPYEMLDWTGAEVQCGLTYPARAGQALSLNISPGGMLLMMDGEPMLQDRLRVRLPQNSLRNAGSSLAKVCWTRSVPVLLHSHVVFVGVRFLAIDGVSPL